MLSGGIPFVPGGTGTTGVGGGPVIVVIVAAPGMVEAPLAAAGVEEAGFELGAAAGLVAPGAAGLGDVEPEDGEDPPVPVLPAAPAAAAAGCPCRLAAAYSSLPTTLPRRAAAAATSR